MTKVFLFLDRDGCEKNKQENDEFNSDSESEKSFHPCFSMQWIFKNSPTEEAYDSCAIYSAGFTTLPTNTGTFLYRQPFGFLRVELIFQK